MSMKIREIMDPEKKTIEYAEALNCMASYEINNSKHDEAIKKIK